MRGYERSKDRVVYRFTRTGSGPESRDNVLAMLNRPWYKARYLYWCYGYKSHTTIIIRRKATS